MKVANIVEELNELERKRDEISTVLNESAFGEPALILQNALEESQKKVDTFLSAEFTLMATAVHVTTDINNIALSVGETEQITAHATLSNGELKDITKVLEPTLLFRDFDAVANNTGVLTSVSVNFYEGEETTLRIVKTYDGFHVDDLNGVQGLVVHAGDPNEFTVYDMNGKYYGIDFTTDGNEVVGDNWDIDIYLIPTGTQYSSDNTSVVTVDESGLVTGVGGGIATIQVSNGAHSTSIPVVVGDSTAPAAPTILTATSLVEGGEVTFSPSADSDVASYNVYINNVLGVTDVQAGNPVAFVLTPADGSTSYSITMTAVDTSGNESLPSNAVSITPQAPTV